MFVCLSISDGHVLLISADTLLITPATAQDIGEYTCRVTNSVGTASATSYGELLRFGIVSY